MKKIVRKFKSVKKAERVDREYHRRLTPQQRRDILPDLIAAYGDGAELSTRAAAGTSFGSDAWS